MPLPRNRHPQRRTRAPDRLPGGPAADAGAHRRADRDRRRPRLHPASEAGPLSADEGAGGLPRRAAVLRPAGLRGRPGRRAGRDALHRPPARDRRGRRRADGDRLAGRHVPALLPGAARPADGRTPAPPVRLLPRADDRVRGRGPGPSRGGSRVGHLGVGDRAPADRADARHRRHHPARAGRHRPRRPGPVAVHPGRPRHRQDGRRAAPRRLPAVRVPRPAQPVRGAGGRTQRQLLVLHRRRAARAGGDRRQPGHGGLAGR